MSRKRSGQKHKVDQYSLSGEFVKRWDSATDAAIYFKTSQGNISNAARGDRKSAQGFMWKYVVEDDIPDEIWRKHPSLDVQVSNKGRVEITPKHRTFGQALRDGYYRVRIGKHPNRNNFSVHRLIAEAWFEADKYATDLQCNDKAQVNHIDKNPSNNEIHNLEWVTPRDNILHRFNKNLP